MAGITPYRWLDPISLLLIWTPLWIHIILKDSGLQSRQYRDLGDRVNFGHWLSSFLKNPLFMRLPGEPKSRLLIC